MKKNTLFIYSLCLLVVMISSCDKDTNVETYAINTIATLVVENQKGLRNQQIPLSLKGSNDKDYTNLATFYVDGNPIDGNLFSSPSEGFFQVYAAYNLAGTITNTGTQSVEVFQPKRKVLIEDFTGTWCGYCPRMTTLVQEARELTEHLAVVSIHGNSIYTSTDPFTIDEGIFLKNFFEVTGYPTGLINRNEFWDQNNIEDQIVAVAGTGVDASIGLNSELNGDILNVSVELISEADIANNKLVVFLLENNILWDQGSYFNDTPSSPWYQMGNPIPNFRHDHVFRMSLTQPLGNPIPFIDALKIHNQEFSATIPAEFNKSNLSLVAILVNEDNVAINTQYADVNQLKGFQ